MFMNRLSMASMSTSSTTSSSNKKTTIVNSPGATVVSGGHGCTVVVNKAWETTTTPASSGNQTFNTPPNCYIENSPGAMVLSVENDSNIGVVQKLCHDCGQQYKCNEFIHKQYTCSARLVTCPDCHMIMKASVVEQCGHVCKASTNNVGTNNH
jgi:hypothetical protein